MNLQNIFKQIVLMVSIACIGEQICRAEEMPFQCEQIAHDLKDSLATFIALHPFDRIDYAAMAVDFFNKTPKPWELKEFHLISSARNYSQIKDKIVIMTP